MELGSFTIRFPLHLEDETVQNCLDRLGERSCNLIGLEERTYRVECRTQDELEHTGWALYHTMIARCCTVIEVSGSAEAGADAYAFSRDHWRRKR